MRELKPWETIQEGDLIEDMFGGFQRVAEEQWSPLAESMIYRFAFDWIGKTYAMWLDSDVGADRAIFRED